MEPDRGPVELFKGRDDDVMLRLQRWDLGNGGEGDATAWD